MDLGIVFGVLMIIGWLFLFLWIRRDAKLVGLPGSLWGIIACITPCFLGALFYYFVIRRDRMVCGSCDKVNENKSNYCSDCGEELDPSNKISFKLTKEFVGFVISMGASLIVLLYVIMVMLLPSYFKGEPFAVMMNGITEQEVVGHEFIFSNGIYDGRIDFKDLKREITVSGDLTFGKGYMFIEDQAGDMSYMIDLDKDRDEVTYDLSFMKGDVANVRIEMQNAFNGWFRLGFEFVEDSVVSQLDTQK